MLKSNIDDIYNTDNNKKLNNMDNSKGNKPFYKWWQLRASIDLTPSEKLILWEVIDSNIRGAKFLTQSTIMQHCGLKERCVKMGLKKLEQIGLIRKEKVTISEYSNYKVHNPIPQYDKINEFLDRENNKTEPIKAETEEPIEFDEQIFYDEPAEWEMECNPLFNELNVYARANILTQNEQRYAY